MELPGDEQGASYEIRVGLEAAQVVWLQRQGRALLGFYLYENRPSLVEGGKEVRNLECVPGRQRRLGLVQLVNQATSAEPGADNRELILGRQTQVQSLYLARDDGRIAAVAKLG
ncbi:hypothetical protein GCM10009422_22280 [Brevundimonas kwangchunensis]|uniref:Uncharacterized protein n=1 Tax=Brevundimonas kwangchunensis TaxID=322163 RepID=A0ABN1H0P6_9CAUL